MLHVRAQQDFMVLFDRCSMLVFYTAVVFVLIHTCRGQSEVIGPPQTVVALIGDDIILPCNLDPVMNALDMAVEWARPDLNPRFVLVWRDSVELESKKHPSYTNRTSLFTDELKNGNISLKISKVKLSDEGTYRCFVPELKRQTTVKLVVGAASSPAAEINKTSSRVVLQCESAGWYPEPELLWLDGEGNLLSAGPTETLRGPDDLYTVSSRVTVEKRHSNNITCRVQQRNTNQSRETHIHVPEDFFEILSSSSSVTIGLAVSLALCIILLILSAVALLLRKRKHMMNTNRRTRDHPGGGDAEDPLMTTEAEKQNTSSSSTKTKKQTSYTIKPEKNEFIQELMETFLTKLSESISQHTEWKKNTKITNQLQEVKETAEKLKNQLESKNQQTINSEMAEFIQKLMETFLTLDSKLSESISQHTELCETISRAQEDKQKMESEMMRLKNDLDSTKQQWEKTSKEEDMENGDKAPVGYKNQRRSQQTGDNEERTARGSGGFPSQHLHTTDKTKGRASNEGQVGALLPNQQQMNKPQKGGIILEEADGNYNYICLKNTSSEDKLMTGWELKLIKDRELFTYKFQENFTLKAGEGLTLQRFAKGRSLYPDNSHLWKDIPSWNSGDKVKIILISNTKEEHQLM